MYLKQITKLSNDGKYIKWYCSIITNAKNRVSRVSKKRNKRTLAIDMVGDVEAHHIVPKCMIVQGSKDAENIVYLSLREHFICHLLLPKMLIDKKHVMQMLYAVRRLTNKHKYTSTAYAGLKSEYKIKHGLAMKELWKTPEYLAKQKEAVRNGKYSPEHNEANRKKALREMRNNDRKASFIKAGLDAGMEVRDKDKKLWVANSMGSVEGRANAKKTHQSSSHRDFCSKRELSKTKEDRTKLAKKGQQALVAKCGGEIAYRKMLSDRIRGRKKYINPETLAVRVTREPILGWMTVVSFNKIKRECL